jgi:Domain of unknown function (DUF4336)
MSPQVEVAIMELQSFGPNIWFASQPLRFWGLEVGTRMTVIRLADNELAVISPIQLTTQLIADLQELGEVAYIIAPNRYHHLFAAAFQQQYPRAKFLAAVGLAEKCPHLPIDVVISEPTGQIGGIFYRQFPGLYMPTLQGADPLNEVVFYHPESGSLVITDIAFHFDRTSAAFTQAIAKSIGIYDKLQLTILEKWLMRDKAAMEVAIRSVLAWDFDRVMMAHGSPILTGGKSMLKAGYEWLLDKEF